MRRAIMFLLMLVVGIGTSSLALAGGMPREESKGQKRFVKHRKGRYVGPSFSQVRKVQAKKAVTKWQGDRRYREAA
jgi:hypothetical protein